jgi:serine/threonine-protein kinase RsbW
MIAAAAGPGKLRPIDSMSGPAVHLVVPARSENVSLVRHALAGLGDALGMDEEASANLKTVVTEACTNAVVHAYDEGESGSIEVLAEPMEGAVQVVVRDFGHGFRPRAVQADPAPSLRLGLPLIAALAKEFELRATPGGGTELMMLLPLRSGKEDPIEPEQAIETGDETVITVDDDDLAGVIVSRVVSSFAARAKMPIDRLSDALLLSDAISSEGSGGFLEGSIRVLVSELDGTLTLQVGPLQDGAGDRFLAGLEIPTLGASLASLADEVGVQQRNDGEHVLLRMDARRSAAPAGD